MCVGGEGVGDNKEQYTYHSCSSVVVVVFVVVVFVVVVVAAVAVSYTHLTLPTNAEV